MTDTLTLWLGERLLIGSLQGAVVIAAVWLACRFVPRIPAAAQSALWWLVALKLVLTFAPLPALPVPLLPAVFEQQTERVLLPPLAADYAASAAAPSTTRPVNQINTWLPAVIVLWFAVLLIQIGRLVHAHRVLRGIVTRSVLWPDEATSELAKRLGLKRVPQVRLSDEIETPQVCGLREPVVLLPTEMTAFTAEERAMTLCHELMHIRRRDLTFGWVPACAERLFFFHPLARLAAREYVAARESACDAAAVRALGVSVTDYGRLLIRLGIGHVGPALAAGGSPFSASSLKRRLNMLQRPGLSDLSRRWRWALVVVAAVVIPMQLVARTPPVQTKTVVSPDGLHQAEIYLTDIDQATGKVVKLQKLQKKAVSVEKSVVVEKSKPSFDLYTLFKNRFFDNQSQKMDRLYHFLGTNVAEQERTVERQKVDDVKRRVVEKQKAKELDLNKLEMMKLIEAKAQAERAEAEEQKADDARRRIADLQRMLERSKRGQSERFVEMLKAEESKLIEARTQAEHAAEALRRDRLTTPGFLNDQLREMTRQQEILNQQVEEMRKHQEELAAQQRELREAIERLRRATPRD